MDERRNILTEQIAPSHPSHLFASGMSCISQAVLLCANEGCAPLEAHSAPPLTPALHWVHYWFHIVPT